MASSPNIIFDLHSLRINQGGESREDIVKEMQLTVSEGEIIGLFGDSGGGKTLSMLSLIGLVPSNLQTEIDIEYNFDGSPSLPGTHAFYRFLRRHKIAFIFQQAASCLNPLVRIRKQISECLPHGLAKSQRLNRVYDVLSTLGFEDPARVSESYPHELSVGQQQRVLFAQAIIRQPSLIIADEPFAGLDRMTAGKVKDLIRRIHSEYDISFIIVSHDVGMLADLADRFVRMVDGKLESVDEKMLGNFMPSYPESQRGSSDPIPENSLLSVRRVSKHYRRGKGWFGSKGEVTVFDSVEFQLSKGEILGVMGASGSGKSTLGRLIAGLEKADAGSILLNGQTVKVSKMNGWAGKPPSEIQMVFQDPYTSFEPSRPMVHYLNGKSYESLLEHLDLDQSLLERRPFELSGGQLQRFSLLRSLLLDPEVLILDESLSAIDHSSRNKILKLILEYRDQMAIILISHVPEIILSVSDRVIMLKSGKCVDLGRVSSLSKSNFDPEARELLGLRNEVT